MFRTSLRRMVVGLATGALTVSVAWAGTGLAPVSTPADPLEAAEVDEHDDVDTDALQNEGDDEDGGGLDDLLDDLDLDAIGGKVALVGASKVSMYPRPDDYQDEFPGAFWNRDMQECATLSEDLFAELAEDPEHGAHLVMATKSPWPENPDCIYMGGFGIGPMNPVVDWDLGPGDPGYDEYAGATDGDPTTGLGLWVRSAAISDGTDTLVLTVIDAEAYVWDFESKCDDCGVKQLTESIGTKLGIDPAGIVISATHAHSAPEFLGGWGFVPDWYMAQIGDSIERSITEAVADMRPAVIEVGEENARPHNRERRDTYRSAEEQQVAWLRAIDADSGDVVTTVGAFAAHPTTKGTNDGRAHADWPGAFERQLEERFGGIGLHFMTGLGNISTSGGTMMGHRLANELPEVGAGTLLADTDVRVARTTWIHPVTNMPLTALGMPGFFDRKFLAQPSSIRTGQEPETAPCVSQSAFSVELPVAAARIGSDFALTTAPGEVFSNLTNTIKEKSGSLVTMPLGQANDGLGYMPQEFEINRIGQQGLGFAAGGYLIVNYEDSYAIDHCTGDHVLETSIALLNQLNG